MNLRDKKLKEFHEALERNDVEAIKRIIGEVGVNSLIPSDINPDFKLPPLLWAIRQFSHRPNPEIVQALLENGADVNFYHPEEIEDDNVYQSMYVYESILSRFFTRVADAYKQNDIKDFEGWLKVANVLAQYNIKPKVGDFKIFEYNLLHCHFSSSESRSSTETIDLDCAKIYRGSPFLNKILKLFYDPKICKFKELWLPPNWSVTAKDKEIIFTPSEQFVFAILRGDTKTAKSLLDAKLVDANTVISDGRTMLTPLSHALGRRYCGDENFEMVKLLLTYGADPNSILHSVIERASSWIDYDMSERNIKIIQIAKLLLQHGAKPTKADLKCIEKHLIGNLTCEENETVYVKGTKPFADILIDLFNDPSIYNIKYIKLEGDDLELYRSCKETNKMFGGLKCFMLLQKASDVTIDPDHVEDRLSVSMPKDLDAAYISLEKAILAHNSKTIRTNSTEAKNTNGKADREVDQLMKKFNVPEIKDAKKIEENIKVGNQLLKGIIKTKVWEGRLEELSETINYYMPG